MAAAKNEAANESTESSDSSSFGSRGQNDSLLHRNGRYIRVPTNEDHLERVRDECGDFLKSLEMNTLEMQEKFPVDMAEGLGEATSNVKVREI